MISNDVANGPRYLTAFGNTQSEIIVPIADEETQQIVGTLDIESDVKERLQRGRSEAIGKVCLRDSSSLEVSICLLRTLMCMSMVPQKSRLTASSSGDTVRF